MDQQKLQVARFHGFEFDFRTGKLRKGNSTLKLHPQPTRVLALLVSRVGTIVTREEIRKTLWESDTNVEFDVSINSCIRQIRGALGDIADRPSYVETIPRVGYRFIADVETSTPDHPATGNVVSKPAAMRRLAAAFLLAVSMTGALWFYLRSVDSPAADPTDDRISLAVFPFDNLSARPDLEWLCLGLADMLVTDLAQSPRINVLPLDRLYRNFAELDVSEEAFSRPAAALDAAKKSGVSNVVLGNFALSGETLRVSVQVLAAESGELLWTQTAEGNGETSIFPTVDHLSKSIRGRYDLDTAEEQKLDRDITDVTTSSVEALRYWVESVKLHRRGLFEEDIALREKAIELDPDFAVALAGLSVSHSNLGRTKEAEDYARRALEHKDRLSARDRYYIEGWYYSLRERDWGRAIEAYQKGLELDPSDWGLHGLARFLDLLEHVDEAITHFEKLRQTENPYVWSYLFLANCYAQKGQFEEGYHALNEYITRYPNNSMGRTALGWHLTQWERFDEAHDSFRKAELLDPSNLWVSGFRYSLFVLEERWQQAEEDAKRLIDGGNESEKSRGLLYLANRRLYQGRAREALEYLHQVEGITEDPTSRAGAFSFAAHILVETGNVDSALEYAEKAQVTGRFNLQEWEGLFYASLAQAKLGKPEEAQTTADKLLSETEHLPTLKEKRRYHHLLGELALRRGDTARALAELRQAHASLLPRGFGWHSQHVPIWFSLGRAHFEAGDPERAAQWFQRVTDSAGEHYWWAIPYVRSYYFLAKAYEGLGRRDEARECFRRFYAYWNEGDIDRDRVEEAKRKRSMTSAHTAMGNRNKS